MIYALWTEHDTTKTPDWTGVRPRSAEISSLIPGRLLISTSENSGFVLRAMGTKDEMKALLDQMDKMPFDRWVAHAEGMGGAR